MKVTPVGVYIAVLVLCWVVFFIAGGDFAANDVARGSAIFGTLLMVLGWLGKLAYEWEGWRWVALWLVAMVVCTVLIDPLPDAVPGVALAGLFGFALWTWPGYYDWKRPRRRARA